MAALGIVALLLAPSVGASSPTRSASAGRPSSGGSSGTAAMSLGELSAGPWTEIPYSEPGWGLPGAVATGPAAIPSVVVVVTLPFTDPGALSQLLSNLQDPSSPQYHQFLTASSFDQEFGGSSSSLEALVGYFQASGATQVTPYSDRVTITVQASSEVVGEIFGVTIENYTLRGQPYFAPESAPKLPETLAGAVASVVGLSSYSQYLIHTDLSHSTFHPPAAGAPAPITTSGYLSPASFGGAQLEYAPDLQVAYDEQSLFAQYGYPNNSVIATLLWGGKYTGGGTAAPCTTLTTGQSLGDFVPSDISDFFNETLPAGEPHPTIHGVPLAGAVGPGPNASCDDTGANDETTLDLEMAGSLAPGATIYNVYGRNATSAALDNAFAFVLNPIGYPGLKNVSVISNSWGSAEYNDSGWYSDLEVAEARGISVLASTGDAADNPSSPKWPGGPKTDFAQFPAAEAFNTFGTIAVGGTTVTLDKTTLALQSQIAWNDSPLLIGSEGGISHVFNETVWQNHSASANATLKGAGRGVPDLAAIANNTLITISIEGYEYQATNATNGGSFEDASGTSVACPVEAGILAEIDHVLQAAGNGRLGFLDPGLYSVEDAQHTALTAGATTGFIPTGPYTSPLPALPVMDVTSGSNNKYHAKAGWDLVTGWGSLDAYNYTIYVLNVSSVGVPGHLSGVSDDLNLTNLQVTTPGNPYYNASIQQNFFLADSLGAPLYWIQNVIYINWSHGWAMNDSGWVVFPFYGQYPSLTDYEYNFPLVGAIVSLPAPLNVSTNLSVPHGPDSSVVTFSVGSNVVSLPVPGGAYVIGGLWDNYSWQGTTYENGPYPGNVVPGGLSPQFGLVGGPSGGTGHFAAPTAGTLRAWLRPFGSMNWITPVTTTFDHSNTQTGESALNLAWTRVGGSSNDWSLSVVGGSHTQGVFAYDPQGFNATFQETGLPGATAWFVNATSSTGVLFPGSSSSSKIVLSLPNGSYTYTATSVSPGYRAPSGSVDVSDAPVTRTVPFSIVGYNVTFGETGLPPGTLWYVNITNRSGPVVDLSGSSASLGVNLPNGAYNFTLASRDKSWRPSPGYTSTFSVNGANLPEAPSFEEVTFTASYSQTGLPYGSDPWYVNATNRTGSVFSVESVNGYANLTLPNGSYTFLVASGGLRWGPDPGSGALTIQGANRTVPVVFSEQQFDVTFEETGLPAGTLWFVNGTGAAWGISAASSSGAISLSNGTYSYTIASSNKSFAPSAAPSPFNVTGRAIDLTVPFELVTYVASFHEGGDLPPAIPWYVNVSGQPSVSCEGCANSVTLPNGTYEYDVTSADKRYEPSPSSGRLTVDGSGPNVTVNFTELQFDVNFTESELPSGAQWFVNVSGEPSQSSAGGPFEFLLSNGSYPYTVASTDGAWLPTPASGTLEMRGPTANVSVLFSRIAERSAFDVTFTAQGLPDGIPWYVNITEGASLQTLDSSVTSAFLNGSFSYAVASADHRWAPNVTSGMFVVTGTDRNLTVLFHAVTFAVGFTESGLPDGMSWTVTFNGNTTSATSASLDFPAVSNGTYAFVVESPAGYNVSSAGGPVVVDGHSARLSLTFSPIPGSSSSPTSAFGSIPWWVWLLLIVGVIGVAIALALRRRRGNEQPPAGSSPPPGANLAPRPRPPPSP
ncbi:MAG: S8 family serine peptidase [Thermoplasmata archaeon]|nr:S8 family serine peptidase [Thermoplasmata archaeon]